MAVSHIRILLAAATGSFALMCGAQAEPIATACTGSLACFVGVDAGLTNPALDPSAQPRTNATAAKNEFLTKVSNVRTQTFENAALGTGGGKVLNGLVSGGDPLGVLKTGTGATDGTSAIVNSAFANGEFFGRFNTTTSGAGTWLDLDAVISLAFKTPASAFGFFATDVGDFDGALRLDITFVGNTTLTIDDVSPAVTSTLNGSLMFFGMVDSTRKFSSIRITVEQSPNSIEVVGLDDILIADLRDGGPTNPVPEPGSLALLGFGLLGLAAARRRRA